MLAMTAPTETVAGRAGAAGGDRGRLIGLGLLGVGAFRQGPSAAALTRPAALLGVGQVLRTVVLLRRQLASEPPRRNPWVRLRSH